MALSSKKRKARRKLKAMRRQQYIENMNSRGAKRTHRTAADIIANMDGLTHRTTVNCDGHAKRLEPIETLHGTYYRVVNPKGIRKE